jgi:hypothetical protein
LDEQITITAASGKDVSTLAALRLRASRRMLALLTAYGLTPEARSKWAEALGSGRPLLRRLDRELAAAADQMGVADPKASQPV